MDGVWCPEPELGFHVPLMVCWLVLLVPRAGYAVPGVVGLTGGLGEVVAAAMAASAAATRSALCASLSAVPILPTPAAEAAEEDNRGAAPTTAVAPKLTCPLPPCGTVAVVVPAPRGDPGSGDGSAESKGCGPVMSGLIPATASLAAGVGTVVGRPSEGVRGTLAAANTGDAASPAAAAAAALVLPLAGTAESAAVGVVAENGLRRPGSAAATAAEREDEVPATGERAVRTGIENPAAAAAEGVPSNAYGATLSSLLVGN